MNIATLLTNAAARLPDHPAVIFQGETVTFGQLNAQVDGLAWGLEEAGLGPGDRCVLMMPNSPDWIRVYYALAKLGAVVIPINFLFRSGELTHIFRDSGARALFGHADYLDPAAEVAAASPAMDVLVLSGDSSRPGFISLETLMLDRGPFPTLDVKGDDPWAIIYTSGTTGSPKGAVLTHHNLASNARIVAEMRHTEPGDVVLGVLPLFHIYGVTSVLNAGMYLGLTVRLWEHFQEDEVFEAIGDLDSTILIAVPTILTRLAQLAATEPKRRSSLRFVISGGASLPVEVLRRFEALFETTVYEGYGLTECSPVCVENPQGRPTRPGAIGRAIPEFEARVVDDRDRDLPAGEVGELIVRGPGVMKEYLNQPQATAETLRGGWLHTGDLARTDDDGYIYIVDRKKELIIRGGYNVYPREIEEVLYEHEAVLEAAVIGAPHPDLGGEVTAVVALRPGFSATPDEIRRFVKDRVAPYKYPRKIKIVEELPKTATGKIFKRQLSLESTETGL